MYEVTGYIMSTSGKQRSRPETGLGHDPQIALLWPRKSLCSKIPQPPKTAPASEDPKFKHRSLERLFCMQTVNTSQTGCKEVYEIKQTAFLVGALGCGHLQQTSDPDINIFTRSLFL